MKGPVRRINNCWLATASAVGLWLLAACGSGTPEVSPAPVENPEQPDPGQPDGDPDLPINDPGSLNPVVQTAVPVITDTETMLVFQLVEDGSLRGNFFIPEDPPAGQIALTAIPSNGLLTKDYDSFEFLYVPNADFNGEDSFTYATYEGLRVSVTLKVAPVNDAPVLSANLARVAEQGSMFTVELDAVDADGPEDTLRYSAVGLPAWLQLDAATGVLSGVPAQSDTGFTEDFTLRVTDESGLFDELKNVRFEVIDINDAPTVNLSQLPDSLLARESVSARVFPDDADGDAVTLVVENNEFVSGFADKGVVTLTAADINDVMDVNIVIRATDRLGRMSRSIVPLTLYPLTESGKGITLSGSKQGRGIHLVMLGDGYAVDQQRLFRTHVEDAIDNMASDSGIAGHLGAFNIHMISTVSVDSGADDNDTLDSRDTAYGSRYNCRSIQRLICAETLPMFEAALGEYPSVEQIVLLVNDQRYGGSGNSGGSVAITSAYYPDVALHEMGHSLADLADEYVDPYIVESSGIASFEEGRYPNISAFNDPAQVPWSHWIDTSKAVPQQEGELGVGVFEGGLYRATGIYRPTSNSRMNNFDADFGPVNSEQWILRLYTLTEGIRGFAPMLETVSLVAGNTEEFKVSPIFGPEIQAVQWLFNGVDITQEAAPNELSLTPVVGEHTLTLTVSDISGGIRKAAPHAGIFTWTWKLIVE